MSPIGRTISESTTSRRPSVDVASMLESTARGQLDPAGLIAEMTAYCRGDSDATWEALALLDQYFRRGRIHADVFAAVKAELHALVFNTRAPTQPVSRNTGHRHAIGTETADSDLLRDFSLANKLSSMDASPEPAHRGNVDRNVDSTIDSNVGLNVALHPAAENISIPSAAMAAAAETPSLMPAPAQEIPQSLAHSSATSAAVGIVLIAAVAFVAIALVMPKTNLQTSNSVQTLQSVATKTNVEKTTEEQAQTVVAPQPIVEAEKPVQKPSGMTIAKASAAAVATDIQSNATEHAAISEPVSNDAPRQLVAQPLSHPEQNQANAGAMATPAPSSESQIHSDIGFVEDPVVVNEGEVVARLTVRRAGSTRKELLVHWRTLAGSAKADRDYGPTADDVLSFPRGARNAVITVPIVQGVNRQHSDWFEVEILSDASADTEHASTVRATVVLASVQTSDGSDEVNKSDTPDSDKN